MGAPVVVVGEAGGLDGKHWSVFVNDPQVHNKKGPAVQL